MHRCCHQLALWAVVLTGALASRPAQLDSLDSQPRIDLLPEHPAQSVREAEKQANQMVAKAYDSKHTASKPAEKLLDVEAAISSLDEVAKAREAHLKATAAQDLVDLTALEQQSAASNAAADHNLTVTVEGLKNRTRNSTAKLAPNNTAPSADANATKELRMNIDVANKENADVLQQADRRIQKMHANERKYKHVEDMALAKSRENLRKFCKFVYGKKSKCKHPDSNGKAWSQAAQKWKKAGKPMHDAAQWALMAATVDDVKKSIVPQHNFGSWGTQPTSEIRNYLKEHNMHLEPNKPPTNTKTTKGSEGSKASNTKATQGSKAPNTKATQGNEGSKTKH